MLFNSIRFFLFLPVVLFLYYILPARLRHIWLLVASYFFYMCWNASYALLLLFSTTVTYLGGIILQNKSCNNTRPGIRHSIVVICIFIDLLPLFYFKYYNFTVDNINNLLRALKINVGIPRNDVLLPVGISFFTFQALGYLIDVYRGDVDAEKDFCRYALFVSFFPQLVAGPIERSKNLLTQLKSSKPFDWDRILDGIYLIIWGLFLKVILADRVAVFVDEIYGNSVSYEGLYIVVATILFAFQIYCDFYGYSVIAMGSAKMFGIDLMDNFNAPYLSESIIDFWRNWHISLTSWFRDYLYFPLGGNRKGLFRKHINKMIVFLTSGLWHGASLSFVVWGGINGLFQIIEETGERIKTKSGRKPGSVSSLFCNRLLRIVLTFILIDITWIFFRAGSIKDSFRIFERMFASFNPWILFDGSLYECGLDQRNFILILICILLVLIADSYKKRGVVIRNRLKIQAAWFQITVIVFSVICIMLFGIYGPSYDDTRFIYFQF